MTVWDEIEDARRRHAELVAARLRVEREIASVSRACWSEDEIRALRDEVDAFRAREDALAAAIAQLRDRARSERLAEALRAAHEREALARPPD